MYGSDCIEGAGDADMPIIAAGVFWPVYLS